MNTGELTRALSMALAHSVWQGLLAAVLAAMIIAATRKSRAVIRYNMLTLDLLLFLLAVVVTFFRELGSGRVLPAVLSGRPGGGGVVQVLAQLPVHTPVQGIHAVALLTRAGRLLNVHASTVVLIWLLCLLFQLVRMAGGLYRMRNLRTTRVFAPPKEWAERMEVLAARLGVTKSVSLLQSALVNMPVTFGYLKPVLLVPVGILAHLPADQVETILLHELAHIRRNDFVANLLLCLTEAVFFFNPGVRWIAARLREEREACCDDMVLGGVRDRSSYLDALVAFREYAARSGDGYTLALGSGKSDLLWRIRRMLNQENKKLPIMEKAILSLVLTALLGVALISMRSIDRHWDRRAAKTTTRMHSAVAEHSVAAVRAAVRDTVPGSTEIQKAKFPTINTNIEDDGMTKKVKVNAKDAEGNTFELTKVNGQVTTLVINGKTIPNESFDQYMYIFDEIARRSEHGSMNHEDDEVRENDVRAEIQEKQQEVLQRQQDVLQRQREAVQLKLEAAVRNQEKAQRGQDEVRLKAEQDLAIAREKNELLEKEAQTKAEDQYDEQRRIAEKMDKEARLTDQTIIVMDDRNNQRSNPHVLRDLVDNGLVGSEDEVKRFTLDNKALIVNGVKQPVAVFELFRKKYVWNPKDHYKYEHSATTSTSEVWLDDGKDDKH